MDKIKAFVSGIVKAVIVAIHLPYSILKNKFNVVKAWAESKGIVA
jgi:hypothetical protein